MDRFRGGGAVAGARSTPRVTLSPDDALAIIAQRQYDDFSRMDDAIIYQNVQKPARFSQGSLDSPTLKNSDGMSSRLSSMSLSGSRTPNASSRPRSLFSRSKPRQKPAPGRPTVDFRQLPLPVFECILDQLRALHNERLSLSCPTCIARDLVAMQLTCSAWDTDIRKRLYEHIDITGLDSPDQLQTYKMNIGSRLRLLHRTLQDRKLLASMVKSLHVPDPNIPFYLPNGLQNPEFEEYRDLVASIVLICPNLELLTGFYTFYTHEPDSLTSALATRQRLKEHVWIIGENDAVSLRSQIQLSPGLLDPSQSDQFVHYHQSWSALETLMLCSPGGLGVVEHGVFAQVLTSLPGLKHLCVSSFDADDFTDITLLYLPDLMSLRIEECSGVTDCGLVRYAASPAAFHLKSLSLIHQNIIDLMKVSKILTALTSLQKFTMVQSDVCPAVPTDTVLQPLLASSSLEHLHWDIAPESWDARPAELSATPASRSNSSTVCSESQFPPRDSEPQTPNGHLALSILHSGFPRLRTLRAPQDMSPPGVLQAVCRPLVNGKAVLQGDKNTARPKPLIFQPETPNGNSLQSARIRAQNHIDGNIEAAQEFMKVLITDHSDRDINDLSGDSSSSFASSSASTQPTDPEDLFSHRGITGRSPDGGKLAIPSGKQPMPPAELACPWSESLLAFNHGRAVTIKRKAVPVRKPLRTKSEPIKIREYSLPSFIGRVASTVSRHAQPPRFNLLPDIPGRDGNGGIIGWGDLLRVGEKANLNAGNGVGFLKDGCIGAWNRDNSSGKGPEWWKHTERERRREGTIITLQHFF